MVAQSVSLVHGRELFVDCQQLPEISSVRSGMITRNACNDLPDRARSSRRTASSSIRYEESARPSQLACTHRRQFAESEQRSERRWHLAHHRDCARSA